MHGCKKNLEAEYDARDCGMLVVVENLTVSCQGN